MKKYTNKILLITFIVLVVAMEVFLIIGLQKAKKYTLEHPRQPRIDSPEQVEAIHEIDLDNTLPIDAQKPSDSL